MIKISINIYNILQFEKLQVKNKITLNTVSWQFNHTLPSMELYPKLKIIS